MARPSHAAAAVAAPAAAPTPPSRVSLPAAAAAAAPPAIKFIAVAEHLLLRQLLLLPQLELPVLLALLAPEPLMPVLLMPLRRQALDGNLGSTSPDEDEETEHDRGENLLQ